MLAVRLGSWIVEVSSDTIRRADGHTLALPAELTSLTRFSREWRRLADLKGSELPSWQVERLCLAGVLEVGIGDRCAPIRARRYYEEQCPDQAARRSLTTWLARPPPRTMWIGLPHANLARLDHSTAAGLADILSAADPEAVAVFGVLPDLNPSPRTAASMRNLIGLSERLGVRLGIIGGDHLATWSLLSEVKAALPGASVQYVHVDAHHDLSGYRRGARAHPLNHANFLANLLQRGLVDHAVLIGRRDRGDSLRSAIADGLPVAEALIADWPPRGLSASAHTHLSVDLDVLDPRCAPAVSSPIDAGWTLDALTDTVELILQKTRIDSCSVVECGGGDPDTTKAALAVIEVLGR